MLERSPVILAGGSPDRFGKDKAFVQLMGKPLVSYVFDKVHKLIDETLIVISSGPQVKSYPRFFGEKARIVVDKEMSRSPLVGASAGFENASARYSLLLPCDTPFLSRKVLSSLFDICGGVDSVIPDGRTTVLSLFTQSIGRGRLQRRLRWLFQKVRRICGR